MRVGWPNLKSIRLPHLSLNQGIPLFGPYAGIIHGWQSDVGEPLTAMKVFIIVIEKILKALM